MLGILFHGVTLLAYVLGPCRAENIVLSRKSAKQAAREQRRKKKRTLKKKGRERKEESSEDDGSGSELEDAADDVIDWRFVFFNKTLLQVIDGVFCVA